MKKKNLVKIIGLIFLSLIVVGSVYIYSWVRSGGTSKFYQHDADIVRLNDLKQFGLYIEAFHQKTGKYPFEGKNEKPNYILIATKMQQKYIKGGPPYPHEVTDVETLKKELENGLNIKISIPFDPQRVPSGKPNFYIYLIQGDTYSFAIHLHNPFSFANKMGPNYYKLEISNQPSPSNKIWDYTTLMNHDEFIKESSKKLHKPGYFKKLREKQNL